MKKRMLLIDVDQYHHLGTETAFEEMIAAAASLAVFFAGRGNSLGLVTNARIDGQKSPYVPISRSVETLPALLETLARITMTPQQNFTQTCRQYVTALQGANCMVCAWFIDENKPYIRELAASKNNHVQYFVSEMDEDGTLDPRLFDAVELIEAVCV